MLWMVCIAYLMQMTKLSIDDINVNYFGQSIWMNWTPGKVSMYCSPEFEFYNLI